MWRRVLITLLLLLSATLLPETVFAQGMPIVNVVTGKGGATSYSLTPAIAGLDDRTNLVAIDAVDDDFVCSHHYRVLHFASGAGYRPDSTESSTRWFGVVSYSLHHATCDDGCVPKRHPALYEFRFAV